MTPASTDVKPKTGDGYKTATADESVRRAALALGPGAGAEALIKKALAG